VERLLLLVAVETGEGAVGDERDPLTVVAHRRAELFTECDLFVMAEIDQSARLATKMSLPAMSSMDGSTLLTGRVDALDRERTEGIEVEHLEL
jgi:hypothetical protein